jgi:hypothetical protein
MPGKPFGVGQVIAEAAVAQGILLPYDSAGDSLDKCRDLLQQAGFEAITITTQAVSDDPIELTRAIAFLDERLDHPAWRVLQEAPQYKRDAIRAAYTAKITKLAVNNCVPDVVAQNFAYGQKR